MKPLPEKFSKDRFDFELCDREGDVAMFRKVHQGGTVPSFEVVIVQKHRERTIAGKLIPAGEAMPYSEQWGEKGWTYPDRKAATDKMSDLVLQEKQKARDKAILSPCVLPPERL